MRATIKRGSRGEDVKYLQTCLNNFGYTVTVDGIFGPTTEKLVQKFQENHNLDSDGVVGIKTWLLLESDSTMDIDNSHRLNESDFVRAANELGVSVAVIKAVQEVETGGRGGFVSRHQPTILFEGHIFWNQLKRNGKNPEDYVSGNENILYPKWTKSNYTSGISEYTRLEKAMKIDADSALCSASWGMFQIMGFNYISCGCSSVQEFVDLMKESEGKQLDLFIKFIKFNGLDVYLKNLDWAGFARKYNGPGYKENRYDEKLEKAYRKYLK